jgi:hypothetical protein
MARRGQARDGIGPAGYEEPVRRGVGRSRDGVTGNPRGRGRPPVIEDVLHVLVAIEAHWRVHSRGPTTADLERFFQAPVTSHLARLIRSGHLKPSVYPWQPTATGSRATVTGELGTLFHAA